MVKNTTIKKVVLSVTVNPEILEGLREHKQKSGMSVSWVVSNLLSNYLEAMANIRYD